MKTNRGCYHGYRFPSEIISHAVWLYHRFCLSFRDVEELLAERGIVVSYETIRQWCQKFGPRYARTLRRRQGRLGDIWHLDELFVNIQGKRHYLWRAVDQDGDVIDILVQQHRDARAAKRFFRKLLKGQGTAPWRLVTDKLRSIRQLTGKFCLLWSTTPISMRTTGLRSPINRPANENDRCDGSNQLDKLSGSFRSTESS